MDQEQIVKPAKNEGIVYDINTAADEICLTTVDMMATFNVGKTTIWGWVKKGVIPPPFEFSGRAAHWNIAQIRKWRAARAIALTEAAEKKMVDNCKIMQSIQNNVDYNFL